VEKRLGRAVACMLKALLEESRKKIGAQTGRRETGILALKRRKGSRHATEASCRHFVSEDNIDLGSLSRVCSGMEAL
jgi:nitrite reductase/ring-hydroxylating ferredoxin subunit